MDKAGCLTAVIGFFVLGYGIGDGGGGGFNFPMIGSGVLALFVGTTVYVFAAREKKNEK